MRHPVVGTDHQLAELDGGTWVPYDSDGAPATVVVVAAAGRTRTYRLGTFESVWGVTVAGDVAVVRTYRSNGDISLWAWRIGPPPTPPQAAVSTRKRLHRGPARPIMETMRCNTCKGAVHFVDGGWRHLVDTKCVAVVVEWPDRPLVEDDEAA